MATKIYIPKIIGIKYVTDIKRFVAIYLFVSDTSEKMLKKIIGFLKIRLKVN